MTRNENNAAYVNIKTPIAVRHHLRLLVSALVFSAVIILIPQGHLYHKSLALNLVIGIIIITYETRKILTQSLGRQTPVPPPKRDGQCSGRQGAGSAVSGTGFFRPAGSDPGQIRNAPPSAERFASDQRGRCPFWFFPSSFLQGAAGLYARRVGRAHSQAARPQTGTQADARGAGIRRTNPCPGTLPANPGSGPAHSKKVCGSGSPQDLGAGAGGREKKQRTP